jgi:hypothetical protein
MNRNDMVVVKWRDARIFQGMYKLEEALNKEMETFDSVGYLVEETSIVTKIAHEITDSGEYRDILLIPSGSIISVDELTRKAQTATV